MQSSLPNTAWSLEVSPWACHYSKKREREKNLQLLSVKHHYKAMTQEQPLIDTQKCVTFILNIFARSAYWLKFSISSLEMKESLEWQVWCKFYQNFEDPKICSCIWWKRTLGLPTFKQSQSYCPWYFSNKLIETLYWSARTSVLQKRDAF